MFSVEQIEDTAFTVLVWVVDSKIENCEMLPSPVVDTLHLKEGESRDLTLKEFRALLEHTPRLREEYYTWLNRGYSQVSV